MYPKGTIDLENAKHNIYDVSIANRGMLKTCILEI